MSDEHGRILVVDDTRLNRTILARALENQGHEVVEAENGRVAMEVLEADGASASTSSCSTSRCRRWTATRPSAA